jgi:hemoglobin
VKNLFKRLALNFRQLLPFREKTVYEKIGGLPVIDKLVDDFYQIMSTDPLAVECFATHAGREIRESAEKLKAFLSGWTGGPQLYLEKYGHPKLRMRHFPFKFGIKEGEQWLYCMKKALSISPIPSHLQEEMMNAFQGIVNMLVQGRD